MDNLTYHQVNNIVQNANKTSSSTSTTSSISSNNPTNSNLNISPFPNINYIETSVASDFVTVGNEQICVNKLPKNIRFELDQLELEFLEGDLTQKGYEKKKARLLASYLTDLPIISSLASCSSSTIIVSTPKTPNSVNRPTVPQENVVRAIPVRIQQNLRKTRRKNKDDSNLNRYHSDFIRYDDDNDIDYEIRQEAVKAALSSYTADQNQSIVPSSKRNTAYLLPLNNAPPVLAKEEDTTSESIKGLISASVPFPVPITEKDSSNIPITKSSAKIIEDAACDVFSDDCDSMDDELLESNHNLQHTPKNQTTYENRPILLFQTPKSPTSPQPKITPSPPTILPNIHSNQYYDYCPNNDKNLFKNHESVTTIAPENSTQSPDSLLSSPEKSIQLVKSPVVAIIQNITNTKQTSHLNNSKILVPKKGKVTPIRTKSDDQSATNINNSSLTHTNEKQRPASIDASITQKISSISLNQSGSSGSEIQEMRQPTRVSAKIQQLLNTLKRPKRRPLNEYFEDNQEEVAIPPLDPAMPKPEGGTSVPACGEPLLVPASFPQSIEAAIHKFANSSSKATCISVLDQSGKCISSLTYNKLLKRAQQTAYHLLNKLTFHSPTSGADLHLKLGDRVALVFPNNDPIGFTISFCACLMAGLVALPIDVPSARRDAGSQNLGFLLGQVGASCVLTSDICFKALPKNPNTEMIEFKGWPKIPWLVIEQLTKSPPKDWSPPNRIPPENPAYIEYSSLKDGSVTGVIVTRNQMLCHCQTLNISCQYAEGEYVVCVLDYKREFGLWHGVQSTIFNGMHMLYVPYSVMKVNPAIWLTTITKYKASVALVKSRDMHWGMMAQRDHKDINLSSLRMLLVADGANPWSLSSCDTFLDDFQSKGLKAETICPTAGSSETLTLSIRRPNRSGPQSSGRGVLSMSGLSYGVVRVDQENSLTSLTLQDVGQVLPGSLVSVIRISSSQNITLSQQATSQPASATIPTLCQTDEIGEICISSRSTANSYFGLQGLTTSQFKLIPHGSDNFPIGKQEFVRSGLLGFLGPSGLIFICGSKEGLIEVSGRRHNTDDIIATVLAVEPMKFIFRGRIAVFSIKVLRDERVIIIAEQRPDATEEECFQWMSRVLQAVDSIHHVGVYCLSLVPPNTLPKTPLGGIHIPETRSKFLDGTLHPTNVLMCPHTCVLNLPKPREHHPEREVGPSAVLAGSIVQGRRLAEAKGRDICDTDESDTAKKFQFLGDILRWRASSNPDHVLFTVINAKGQEVQKLTCSQLHKKAERVACLMMEKGQLTSGDHVALIFSPSVDLVAAFYGCLYIGVVPVPIRPPHLQNIQTTLPTIKMIVEMSRIKGILTTNYLIKLFKSKEANAVIESRQWPILLDIDENIKKKLSNYYKPSSSDQLAYLDFSVSTTGMLAGVQISHGCSTTLCRAIKLSCELYPSREVVLCLDPYSGLGFVLWCLNSIYSGHHSILVPPVEVEINPCIWLATVSHFKVRDTFCSYSVMELCTKGLRSSVIDLKQRGINLSCVRTCAIIAEERPRIQLTNSFTKLFQSLGLPARSVSTTFGCRANIAICLQGASDPDPTPVYVDQRALRNDRVTIVEKGSPHSICLLESGKLLPGVKVVIANPETKGQCADSHLGEIWVQTPHNSNGYFNIYGEDVQNDHFNCHLATGDTLSSYARTGYLGFVRRTEDVKLSNSDPHDAVYIVGSLDETLMIKGMRYHPIDLEATILRCHKKICECACFTWTNLLVVVVELDGNENEALDLIPLVTNSVLEDHYLIVGVVVVVDPGVVPINSRGEKQRMHLRDGFLSDLLDPIYVAYNM